MTEHAQAPAPNRGSALTISWSMISIPVSVMKGIADVKSVPARSQFTPDGDPVGHILINKVTGISIERDEIVKKSQASDGTWVELLDEEIEEVTAGGPLKGVAAIETTIPLEALGKEYVVESYDFVRPALRKVGTKRVPDPAAEKAFALLLSSLKAEGRAALIKYAGRGGAAKYAAITPEGLFLQLAFAGEVRIAPPLAQPEVTAAELEMGRRLIAAMDNGMPVLTDDAGDKIRAFVDAKAGGVVVERPAEVEYEAPVIDLMAALTASLAAAAPAPAPAKKAAAKKTKAA